jgi:hypothetical protein
MKNEAQNYEIKSYLQNEEVKIVDQAIDSQLYAHLVHYVSMYPMFFGWKNTEKSPRQFWHRNFVLPGTYENHYDPSAVDPKLNYENFVQNLNPISLVAEYIRQNYFNGNLMTRVWINVQTFGDEGDIHRDYDTKYYLTSKSAILYVQNTWEIDWGGDFVVFDENKEIMKSVLIKPNRLVVFNGCLQHAVRPMSRFSQEPRRALVFGCEVVK